MPKTSKKAEEKEPVLKVESVQESEPTNKEDAEEEEVVTVKTSSPTTAEKAKEESSSSVDEQKSPLTEKKEEEKIETSSSAPSGVTSFSLIDSDKKDASEPAKDETKADTPTEDKKDTENVKASTDDVNKWIENYNEPAPPEEPKKERSFFKFFLIILLVLSLVAAVAGGVIYYQKSTQSQKSTEVKEEPKPVEVEEPTSTPTPDETESKEGDYSEYSLSILNGSGVPGEAGYAENLLTDLEFSSIDTGNADNYDYEDTEVYVKDGLPEAVFKDLKTALEEKFIVGDKSMELSEDSEYDIEIIVGVRK